MESEFKVLLSGMILYRHNFRVLHWNAKGEKFDRIHQLADEYSEMLHGDIDTVAEMLMRLSQDPPSYDEVVEILRNDTDIDFKIIDGKAFYDYEEFSKLSNSMLNDILVSISNVLGTEEIAEFNNVGIKAELEGLYNKYDLQYRYLNKRREDN